MSFGEELLKALSATQYRAAESPYAIAGQAVNAVTPNLVNPYGSMGSNLGIAAGSGILAALLTGLAENDATRRNTEFAPSISAFMDADPTQQAQLAAKEPRLSSLYNVLQANALTNDMELKQKIAEKTGLMPYVAEEEKQKYLATQPYKQEEDLLKQSNQLLGAEGKMMIPGQGIVDVTNPLQREADLDAMKIANQLRAKEGKTLIGGKLEQIIDQTGNIESKSNQALKDLQSRFNATEAAKQYTQVRPAVEAMVGALKDNGIVTDQELSRYSILLIEPGMAVREGEQAAILASQSVPQEWKGQMQRAANGESGLQPEVREGLKRLAMRAYEGRLKNYNETLQFFKNEAAKLNTDPNRIAYLGEGIPMETVFGAETKSIGGTTYRRINDGWEAVE